MKVAVLLNPGSGTTTRAGARVADDVRSAFEAAGMDADVRLTPGPRLRPETEAALARKVDVVAAGGGDGTLNAVASVLAGRGTPLGILPLGTLNHFAKDLGVPLDLAGAVEAIVHGRIETVDVGRVADRIFLNNSSLGIYARALVDRDRRRRREGLGKWTAMALAAMKMFRRSPLVEVRIDAGGQRIVRRSPLVFVGNNCYQLDLLNVGRRPCLSGGELSLYIANSSTRWGLVKLAVRAALGRLKQDRDFDQWRVPEATIETRRQRLHVALDGEITQLAPPLEYRIWPQALRVMVPPQAALVGGEADGNRKSANDEAATSD